MYANNTSTADDTNIWGQQTYLSSSW